MPQLPIRRLQKNPAIADRETLRLDRAVWLYRRICETLSELWPEVCSITNGFTEKAPIVNPKAGVEAKLFSVAVQVITNKRLSNSIAKANTNNPSRHLFENR
jgi:hypothetical protein